MKTERIAGITALVLVFCLLLMSCNRTVRKTEAERVYIAAIDAYQTEDFYNSLNLVSRALELDPHFYQASFLKGKILFFTDRTEEAKRIFYRLISRFPAYTEARIWYIRCLILKGEYRAAQDMLDKELSFNQTDWRIYSLYSLLAQRMNNYEKRLAMNRRAEAVLSGSASVYIDMAFIWYSLGFNARAQIYLEKARHISDSGISFQELERIISNIMETQR